MQIKKKPRARLEKFSKIFFELGLVLVLFIIYQLLEVKTYESSIHDSLGVVTMTEEDKEDVPIINREEIIIPKNTPPPPALPNKIDVIQDDDNIEETIVNDTETDETEAVIARVDPDAIVEEVEEEVVIEDVPFIAIEEAPLFPGCKGTKAERKICFSESIKKFFIKRFDGSLANQLGLSKGKKRIIVLFSIDNKGNVSNINARAPHPTIQKEVINIIRELPKMTPGNQRGKPVGVKFSLPITFLVK